MCQFGGVKTEPKRRKNSFWEGRLNFSRLGRSWPINAPDSRVGASDQLWRPLKILSQPIKTLLSKLELQRFRRFLECFLLRRVAGHDRLSHVMALQRDWHTKAEAKPLFNSLIGFNPKMARRGRISDSPPLSMPIFIIQELV